ncbi:hypothetical protein [Paenibacillus humicus]|uniref:hypothetical protein n=1 Tax=Paenibacillus humicus TaxID=412861 RepID=UPI000FDB7C0B|nr:hypothetical protein [Paenibacillus humicus]
MTLINAVYVPTGIVLSGDSRTTIFREHTQYVLSDSSNKVFVLFNRFGVATSGDAFVNGKPIEHFIKDFEFLNTTEIKSTHDFAELMLKYFKEQTPLPRVNLIVVGYDESVPFVYSVVTQNNHLEKVNSYDDGSTSYGMFRSGDIEIVNRLTPNNVDVPHYNAWNLQDAVDYSRHLVRTTIDQLRFEPRFPTVGGQIDTLVITPKETKFLSKKELGSI